MKISGRLFRVKEKWTHSFNSMQTSLHEPLITERGPGVQHWVTLLLTVASSAVGMLSLKYAQVHGSLVWLCIGYTLEAIAFAMYPINLISLPLQVIVVLWSASSNVTAFVGGVVLYGETVNTYSVVGCLLNIAGVVLVARSQSG